MRLSWLYVGSQMICIELTGYQLLLVALSRSEDGDLGAERCSCVRQMVSPGGSHALDKAQCQQGHAEVWCRLVKLTSFNDDSLV